MEENDELLLETKKIIEETIIGLSLSEAIRIVKESNCTLRISKINGKPTICTRDYVQTRINVEIENGFIKAISIGGWN